MGSKVVVTYKRKRLFSRSDHSLVNLHSDTSSKSAKSKNSDSFPKQEGPIAECTLQNNDIELGIPGHGHCCPTWFRVCHAYSKENLGEDVLHSEKCNSLCCSQCNEKYAAKPKMLYSACSEKEKPTVSDETLKFTLEKKCSPTTDVELILSNANVYLDGTTKVRCKIDSAGQSNAEENISCAQSKLSFVKLGSEYEDNSKKILTVPHPPVACSGAEPDPKSLETSAGLDRSCQTKGTSILETSNLEETDKLNKDQYNCLHNNSGIKRKLTSALITFCRRSKRNRADIASKSEWLPAASCLVDLNERLNLSNSVADNEEKDIDKICSFSAPVPATSTVVLADNQQHLLHGEAEDASNTAAQCCQGSWEQTIQQKVCMDVQDSHHMHVTTQRLSNEDVKSRRMLCDVSGRGNYLSYPDLSVTPRPSHNFDCNLPPDGGSDENQPIEMLEDVHDSLGPARKIEEDMMSFPVQHMDNGSPVRVVSDKGKCIENSLPFLSRNSSKNNYIQFFPESKSDSMLNLANNSEKVIPLVPSSLQSSNTIDLSVLQLEQMVDGRPCFPSSYEWPYSQSQPRESFLNLQLSTSDRTQSFSRDKMMLDNILTRARAVRGNRSSFLDKFEYPTTWLEEELDSLWIGVRRHGRGNWDAILGDRRLHFLPWKSPWDLAERWQVEQSQLLCSMPVSLGRYISPPDLSSEHASSLHHSWLQGPVDEVELSLGHSHPLHLKNNKMNIDLQKPVTNLGSGCLGLLAPSEGSAIMGDESSSTAALMNGSLPHWLRTAAEVPPGPSRLTQTIPMVWLDHPSFNCPGTSHQPWLSNRYTSTHRRPEPQKVRCSDSPLVIERGKARPELIIIPSGASSEETISDDHS